MVQALPRARAAEKNRAWGTPRHHPCGLRSAPSSWARPRRCWSCRRTSPFLARTRGFGCARTDCRAAGCWSCRWRRFDRCDRELRAEQSRRKTVNRARGPRTAPIATSALEAARLPASRPEPKPVGAVWPDRRSRLAARKSVFGVGRGRRRIFAILQVPVRQAHGLRARGFAARNPHRQCWKGLCGIQPR